MEAELSDVAGTPSVYCKVVKEPNPALLGHVGGVHKKPDERTNGYSISPVEYRLVKAGDK